MKRYREVDAVRGIAIILMIFFHVMYNLVMFEYLDFDIHEGFWWVFPRCIAASFLVIVGISLTLSYNRVKDRLTPPALFRKFLFRGLTIAAVGCVISIVTFVVLKDRAVLFGILHLIGVSIILAFPLLRYTWLNLFLGIGVLGAGILLGLYRFDFYWLLWLGFRPENYYPVDYLPLLPWFSFVPIGLFIGNILYKGGERTFPLPGTECFLPVHGLAFLGRHSLVIYCAHLPLIYGILMLLQYLGIR
ncbi:MAG: DUF1624 domain-containing protein [Spirochaetales bacterium]|nr:DUF1624 domain-containing protein [Spirochaetales bacterium]